MLPVHSFFIHSFRHSFLGTQNLLETLLRADSSGAPALGHVPCRGPIPSPAARASLQDDIGFHAPLRKPWRLPLSSVPAPEPCSSMWLSSPSPMPSLPLSAAAAWTSRLGLLPQGFGAGRQPSGQPLPQMPGSLPPLLQVFTLMPPSEQTFPAPPRPAPSPVTNTSSFLHL